MPKKDPRVDAYLAKAPDFAKPVLTQIRAAIHEAVPDVEETIKWSVPAFNYHGPFCQMAAFKEHCRLVFWKAVWLGANGKMLSGPLSGADQFGRLTSVADLPSKKAFATFLKGAAQMNADGVKVPMRSAKKKPALKTPPVLTAALAKNKKAKAAYDAFSPSHRNEYIEWIMDAKSDETRDRRLKQAIEWIAEGKSRNWKYQR